MEDLVGCKVESCSGVKLSFALGSKFVSGVSLTYEEVCTWFRVEACVWC